MTTPSPLTHSPLEDPKGVAVFLCGCNGKVSSRIPLEPLLEEVQEHATVRSVEIMEDCCCPEDLERMRLSLRAGDIDRFLVAGCSWKSAAERFRRLAKEAGMDPSLIELCNLKEQCALVHGPQDTLLKARRLLRISLSRCDRLQSVPQWELKEPFQTILVIGNGDSALTAARESVMSGHDVLLACPGEILLETSGEGSIDLDEGNRSWLRKGADEKVAFSTSTRVIALQGSPGAFLAVMDTPLGETKCNAGAVILALDEEPGINPLKARFGAKGITQTELKERLRSGQRMPPHVIMLAMDESGESSFDPLSTHEAVHNGLFLRTISPDTQLSIVTREVFALGQCEAGYRKAMEAGARILRTDVLPLIRDDSLIIKDMHLGSLIEVPYDLIVLDDSRALPDLQGVALAIGIPLTLEGRLKRPHAKLKPSGSIRPGVFICGTAGERNLGIGPTLEARSAVAGACALLRSPLFIGGEVAEVWPDLCSACLTCVRTCPYSAPVIGEEGKASIQIERCQGCGICVGICPSKAIQMFSFRDDQITAQLEQALRGDKL